MARPKKQHADYFLHSNNLRNDLKVKALRNKFGAEGYGVLNMVFEVLISSDNFKIRLLAIDIELLAGDFGIDDEKLGNIIDYCVKLVILRIEGNTLSSPILDDYLKYLNDYRSRERQRKADTDAEEVFRAENPESDTVFHAGNSENGSEVFHTENSNNGTKNRVFHVENTVFQPENDVFRPENTLSKGKVSKVKISKDKLREGEKTPPQKNENENLIFFKGNGISCLSEQQPEKNETSKTESTCAGASADKEEKKGCGQKKESLNLLQACKDHFLKQSPGYVWEKQDSASLVQLLEKIKSYVKISADAEFLYLQFMSLIEQLPDFWRSKRFTIPVINRNYNEIINEIRSSQQKKQQNHAEDNRPIGEKAKGFARRNVTN